MYTEEIRCLDLVVPGTRESVPDRVSLGPAPGMSERKEFGLESFLGLSEKLEREIVNENRLRAERADNAFEAGNPSRQSPQFLYTAHHRTSMS